MAGGVIDDNCKSKVYCRDCKYYRILRLGFKVIEHFSSYDSCEHPDNYKDTYLEPNSEHASIPLILNHGNDCNWFEPQ